MALELINKSEGAPELWVYGDIGGFWDGIRADDVQKALASVPSDVNIDVRINSGGGDYFDGIAIHSLLSRRTGATSVYVDGLAASAASIIAMAGDSIEMAAGSQMMIHQVQGSARGTWAELAAASEAVKKTNQDASIVYEGRWSGSRDDLIAAIEAETWYTADEAIAAGLADRKSPQKMAAFAAAGDIEKFQYKHIPNEVNKTVYMNEMQAKLFSSFTDSELKGHGND